MNTNQTTQARYHGDLEADVKKTLCFPIIRVRQWSVLVWAMGRRWRSPEQIALSFYASRRSGNDAPLGHYFARRVYEVDSGPLESLWSYDPGLRLATAMQLWIFHELPEADVVPLREFATSELAKRNPILCQSKVGCNRAA